MAGPITQTASLRGAEELLVERDLLSNLQAAIEDLAPGFAADDAGEPALKAVLREYGWDETVVPVAAENQPRFDGVQDRVALEHEAREQMNARSHLLFLEAAYRERAIDASVMVVPTRQHTGGATFGRVLNETTGDGRLFTYHFPLFTPLYLVEYEPP
ncbi:hypothetical protein BRC81_04595 [Halobacteriales archaeon QS_1_68_20]|nr:MAG: hypothetical protein BRC81_04595 [Halobacteriales archaeon QS_1_68_20]